MKIDIERIKRRVFEGEAVRARIVRDHGLVRSPATADELTAMLLASFGQCPSDRPLEQCVSNAEVFRAAVRAIGSNGRPWSLFLRNEPLMAERVHGYDPIPAHRAALAGTLRMEDLRPLLPGQSATGDARAILRWARLLSEVPDYYDYLRALGEAFLALALEREGRELDPYALQLCVVGHIGFPPARWDGAAHLRRRIDPRHLKAPGMGYILASELMRNLGWNGFKPDRHVQRLLDRWVPGAAGRALPEAERLMALIGRTDRSLRTYLTYSLAGIAVAPGELPLAQVDGLVWLLGAYVERKGRESATDYLHRRAA